MITDPIWVRHIKSRIDRNKNFLCVFVGAPGAGKSYAALRWAELLDPEFNVNRICYDASELLALINSNSLRAGSVCMLDEMGVMMSSREWQSKLNIMLSKLFQTIRFRRIVFFFCVPSISFVDVQLQKLLHAIVEMRKIDTEMKISYGAAKVIQTNATTGKSYFKYLRVKKRWSNIPIKSIKFGLPSEQLRAEYEQKKSEFSKKLYSSMEESVTDKKAELTEPQARILWLLQQGCSTVQASKILACTRQTIEKSINLLRKKGIIVPSHKGQEVDLDKLRSAIEEGVSPVVQSYAARSSNEPVKLTCQESGAKKNVILE